MRSENKMSKDKSSTPQMAYRQEFARRTAAILLETKSVLLRPNDPFTLTSGRKSPVYVDCRKLIGFPRARGELMDMAVRTIYDEVGYEQIEVVAGGETAGIPFATLIAERMALPLCYIRKKPKGFGRNARIEGDLRENQNVLLVEDMTTDGGSKLSFIEGIRDAGALCRHCFVIFQYGIFPKQMEELEKLGLHLWSLANWYDVVGLAKSHGGFTKKDIAKIEAFLDSPETWEA